MNEHMICDLERSFNYPAVCEDTADEQRNEARASAITHLLT